VRNRLRQTLYKFLLQCLNLSYDHKGSNRLALGVSPYPRRSPLLMTIYNLRELIAFFSDRSNTKFFKRATQALHNSKKNTEALVLGNGPSLIKLNAAMVSMENPDIWVVNDFYKIRQAIDLKVTHYVLSDPAYFSGLPLESNSKINPVLNYVKSKNATLVIPHWAKDLLVSEASTMQIYFFDDRSLPSWSKNTTPVKPRGYIGLTLYKALGFALYVGYKKIFILGMDNTEFISYTSNAINQLLLFQNHAYEDDPGAFDISNYYLDGMASAFTSMAHNFGDLDRFKGPIFNLDERSLTTRFPKVAQHPWVS
jgi:hypothetical protein